MLRRRVAIGKAVPTVEEPLENLPAKFALAKLNKTYQALT